MAEKNGNGNDVEISHDEYKGNPLLKIGPPNNWYPLSFGKKKAGMLLAALDKYGVVEFKKILKEFIGPPAS